jgi:CubicO group peptidase (beta-lactamase class C family)
MNIALSVRRYGKPWRRLFAPLFFFPLGTHATPAVNHAALIDSLLAAYDSAGVPGASVVVIRDGAVVFQKGYGCGNLESPRNIRPSTNFRLASMTKQFTATCIMMLKEEGKLSYADPLTAFFPAFPAYGRGITVRHLLTHTSGLLDYESLIPDSQSVQIRDAGVLSLLMNTDSTLFAPGTKYSYSNTGYALLALIVEKVSGESFAAFLQRHVFSSLGMNSTVAYEHGISEVPERAYGYKRTDSGFVLADQSVTSAVLGDGGIYSNADDLVKWELSLSTDAIVSRASRDESFADAALNDGTPIDYGYGWHKETFLGIRHPYHNGSTRGFRNTIVRFPSQRLSVIILTNRDEGEPMEIAKKIAAAFLIEQQPQNGSGAK